MPTVTVNPTTCTMAPTGNVHAASKTQNGSVTFNATAACTVDFSDSTVFGVSSQALSQGNNQLNVQCDSGSTNVSIEGCSGQVKGAKTMSTSTSRVAVGSGPTDIIVP